MRRFFVAAVLATIPLAGCDPDIVGFDGTVIAPLEVQRLFSAEAPGQLMVVATLPSHGELADRHAAFCMPTDGERRINVHTGEVGCAEALTAQVAAYAIPRAAEQVDCSGEGTARVRPYYGEYPYSLDDAVAVGNVDAPLVLTGSDGCRGGNIAFTITLAPRAATGASDDR
jgi:hypothetical protein